VKTIFRRPFPIRPALAGIISAGVLLGVAELVGTQFRPTASPLVALGATFIDFTPTWLKNFAVETFGTADKAVLLGALAVSVAILSAVAGIMAYRRWRNGIAAVLLLAAVVGVSVITRAGATPADLLPTAAGTAAGLGALRVLVRRVPDDAGSPGGSAGSPSADAGSPSGSAGSPSDDVANQRIRAEAVSPFRSASEAASQRGARPEPHADRRSFLAAAALFAAVGAGTAVGSRVLGGVRDRVREFRQTLKLPAAASAADRLPAGVQSPVRGTVPFVTPNKDFYRIDTALAVPQVDAETWQLRVHGMVEEELTLTFQDLLDAQLDERHVTLTCVSNPVGGELAGNAKWLGYPLREVMDRVRPLPGADMVLSTSVDGFSASTPLEALRDGRDALLAIGMNGEPLPLEHGFPVRMVVPGLYGFVSATKWVVDLEVTRFADRTAYWTDRGWSATGPIKTASRIEVPRPFARVPAGRVAVGGTAWAQHRGITRVEVQVDDGPWREAELAAEASVDTWRQWSYSWDAEPGSHYLRVRAYDDDGLQTQERADPIPDGASGWHSLSVTVEG
jgi:DMSO/TMAO reductase YedYZ molybdopterin-dependent catalytic subunit